MNSAENKQERRHHWGEHHHRGGWVVLGIIGFIAFAFLFGALVMGLWNWLMPDLFHFGTITYLQAIGLAILGRLLFGSFHHGLHRHAYYRHGSWMRRRCIGHGGDCRDYGSVMNRWGYYEQFWSEEGEKAFNEYVERKKQSEPKSSV